MVIYRCWHLLLMPKVIEKSGKKKRRDSLFFLAARSNGCCRSPRWAGVLFFRFERDKAQLSYKEVLIKHEKNKLALFVSRDRLPRKEEIV